MAADAGAIDVGDYIAARTHTESSLDTRKDLGDTQGIAGSLGTLGEIALKLDDLKSARALLGESLGINLTLGYRLGFAATLELFASLLICEDNHERAVRLWGASARLRDDLEAYMAPKEQEKMSVEMEVAKHSLGAKAFDAAWADGRNMTMEQAYDLAGLPDPIG